MSIRQLPEDVIQKIKSSTVVTSLNGVVFELLKNALDAGSTKVNLYIDYSRGNCTLEDNGLGIPPSEFREDGGLGKLYYTSKHPPISQTHGSNGTFIASLGNLSLLSIASRHRDYLSTNAVTFHGGRTLARHCPCPQDQTLQAFHHGTRVAVKDLFGSMPVRVKHRANLSSDKSYLDKEWSRMLHGVAAIIMAWPSDINILLSDSSQQRDVRLRSQEDADIVTQTSRLLIQASLADSSTIGGWIPVSASSLQIQVKGCIHLQPVASRQCQFISLGIHPVLDEYGANILYEHINNVFAMSAFAMGTEHGYSNDIRSQLKAKRGVERWPMFNFRIEKTTCTLQDVDTILDDRRSDLLEIINLLKAICYGFLKKHQMQPQKTGLVSGASLFSTSKRIGRSKTSSERSHSLPPDVRAKRSTLHRTSKVSEPKRTESLFDDWYKTKMGHATRLHPGNKVLGSDIGSSSQPLIGHGGKLLRKPFIDARFGASTVSLPERSKNSGDAGLRQDITTLEMRHDTTGLSSQDSQVLDSSQLFSAEQTRSRHSYWLQDVLRSWKNPVFDTVEPLIPQAYNDPAHGQASDNGPHIAQRSHDSRDKDIMWEFASHSLQGRVTKTSLLRAEILSQVDRKFVLLRIPIETSSRHTKREQATLVMVDQHAADERCQLEALMTNYFVHDARLRLRAAIEKLDRPLIYEVPVREAELLEQHRDFLGAWGIVYMVRMQLDSNKNTRTIQIDALPPSIIERCRSEPRLLIDLLRREVWKSNDEGRIPGLPDFANLSDKPRTSLFRNCPRGILELLHSRSCRSAIMFNDVLSKQHCEGLIQKLAECAFPFQCAHGRPSMVPLFGLGEGGRVGGWNEDYSKANVNQWRSFLK